jgi:hypothetical protein
MIGYTVPEIRRLLTGLIQRYAPGPERVWSWSRWCRRRQYRARAVPLPAARLCTDLSARCGIKLHRLRSALRARDSRELAAWLSSGALLR